jgi:hypothetical protein
MTAGWLQVKSAAAYADVCERTMRSWLKKGLRHSRLPSRTILVKAEWLDEFLENFEVDRENEADQIIKAMEL